MKIYKDNKYLLAYGSLRKDEYNYKHFKKNHFFIGEFEYIKTISVKGYKMYSLGSYPMAIHTGEAQDIIVCDILSIAKAPYSDIRDMEIGANYIEHSVWIETTVDNVDLNSFMRIFLYENKANNYDSRKYPVQSGDWVKFNKLKEESLIDCMRGED